MNEPEQPPFGSELDAAASIRDDRGRVILQVSLGATIYVDREDDADDVRVRICKCMQDYVELAGKGLRWMRHPVTGEWEALGKALELRLADFLSQVDPTTHFELRLHGGTTPSEASSFQVSTLCVPTWEPVCSYVKFSVPVSFFANHSGNWIASLHKWCAEARPVHGYSGLFINESPDSNIRAANEPTVTALAAKFPGLEIDIPVAHIPYMRLGPKGVSWLTILNNAYLLKLGGVGEVEQKLGNGIVVHKFASGVIIQAGRVPDPGDSTFRVELPLYEKVYEVLQPIQTPKHAAFHRSGIGRMDRTASEEWLRRFAPKA